VRPVLPGRTVPGALGPLRSGGPEPARGSLGNEPASRHPDPHCEPRLARLSLPDRRAPDHEKPW